jgi:hypothetical protein
MRTTLKPVIAASAQAICARTDHRHAIVWSSVAPGNEIGCVRHVEVGRVTICCRCGHRIRELKSHDTQHGTADRIGLEGWNGLAAVNQPSDLPRRRRDVGTRHEPRLGHRCRLCGHACQPDADEDAVGDRRLCFSNSLPCAAKDEGLAVTRRPTRSTLAANLRPERSSWCSSKHGRTASTSSETTHSTSLAADRQERSKNDHGSPPD